MKQPLISIVLATYNRSNVLELAIRTVMGQTYSNWELWVIGDACTDTTEEVVNSFDDERIHFLNRSENFGEQSGPNNDGVARCHGEYIAYLNHDDLWYPDHLETLIEGIEHEHADMVYTLVDLVGVDGANEIACVSPGRRYVPSVFAPASCWLVTRALIDEIGPWRRYDKCYAVPSQDWIFRAWKAGKKLVQLPVLTVIAIQSGKRVNTYAERAVAENAHYYTSLTRDSEFRSRELARYLSRQDERVLKNYSIISLVRFVMRNGIMKCLIFLKVHPYALKVVFRHRRKGVLINKARQRRGLEPIRAER